MWGDRDESSAAVRVDEHTNRHTTARVQTAIFKPIRAQTSGCKSCAVWHELLTMYGSLVVFYTYTFFEET